MQPSSHTDHHPASRRIAIATTVASLLAALLLAVPWIPSQFNDEPDVSWVMFLHKAFVDARQFGTDVVFTMGPWGFTYAGYSVRTFGWSLATSVLLALCLGAGAAAVARATTGRSAKVTPLWGVALVVIATADVPARDSVFFSLATLLLVVHFFSGAPNRWAIASLSAAGAFVGLVKFSLAIAFCGVIVLVTIDDLRRQKLPIAFASYLSSLLLLWLAAGQRLANLPRFLGTSAELARGYSGAMAAVPSFRSGLSQIGVFVAISLGLIILLLFAASSTRAPAPLFVAMGIAIVHFTAFKGTFVRHDEHHTAIAMSTLFFTATIVAPFLYVALPPSKRFLSVLPLLLAAYALSGELTSRDGAPLYRKFIMNCGRQASMLAELVFDRTERLEGLRDELIAERRLHLPKGRSWDAYDSAQSVLIANALPLSSRPVFQSYAAFTAPLARMNANHLRGPNAPSDLLVKLEMWDNRLPLLDDATSWPEILARYTVAGESGEFLVLSRRKSPLHLRSLPILSRSSILGDSVPIPSDRIVRAHLTLNTTLLGRAVAVLFRPPIVWFELTTADGAVRRYRLVPAIAAADGFVVSPAVRRNDDLSALFSGKTNPANRVTSIRLLRPAGTRWFLSERFEITLEELRLSGPSPLPGVTAAEGPAPGR